MTSRKTPAAARPTAVPKPQLTDTERQQMTVAAEGAVAMHRGLEAMRQINYRAVQATLSRFTAAAEQLKTPREPLALVSVSTELMRLQIEGATSYWRDPRQRCTRDADAVVGMLEPPGGERRHPAGRASAMDSIPALPLVLQGLNTGSDRTGEARSR